MNGTDDLIVPYNGGSITIGNDMRDEELSSSETVDIWINRKGCDLSTSEQSRY